MYVFGPVLSRRLGRSLGIDLVPYKTCTLDCVYCECGSTTNFPGELELLVPVDDVLNELSAVLSVNPDIDVCTFSGSGEPTLHSGLGYIIAHIKKTWPRYRVVVLTNGTLLYRKDVREALYKADTVIPSLDAVSEDVFSKMLRPGPGITAAQTIQGIEDFAR
jgi:wyosine [tRNA(Phe)-imidazoG37] synthetase (radical SAM superfamily)